MIKKAIIFSVIILSSNFSLNAGDQNNLITEIALIESETYNRPFPPRKLLIGIDMKNDAYYKLSSKEDIIKAGLLKQGLNIIQVEANNFFEKTGSHVYVLSLKAGDLVLKKEIEIDIQLDTQNIAEKINARSQNIEYKLSMFVGDELIISSKKKHYDKLPLKIEMLPWPRNYKPFNPDFRTDPISNSFPIMGAVAGIYHLIKELTTKKSKEKPVKSIQKWKQITITFRRKDPEGITREIRATITLKT